MVAHYLSYPALLIAMLVTVTTRSRIGMFRMRSRGVEYVAKLRPHVRLF